MTVATLVQDNLPVGYWYNGRQLRAAFYSLDVPLVGEDGTSTSFAVVMNQANSQGVFDDQVGMTGMVCAVVADAQQNVKDWTVVNARDNIIDFNVFWNSLGYTTA